ncbi:MAG: glycosyltransferase [Desulfobacterales bacterium]|nr:glycosyltransferase [Desulfobacterales bacterium]
MVITFNKNFYLIETKSGNLSLRVTCDDGSLKTLHSIYDPEGEAKAIVDAFQFDGRGLLVVLGLGIGYHVAELVKRFPDAEVVVVEAIPEIYELAKKHGKVSELEDKIKFIVGLSADEAIKEITREQMKAGMAPLTVFPLSPAISAFPSRYLPILDVLKKTISVRLWERLKYPKFKDDVLNVALIDFGYFLTHEVEKTIKRLGHRVLKVPIRKGEDGEVTITRLMERIIEFKPDFFLTINHLGFDEAGELASFFKTIEMPAASWYVDSPNIIVKAFNKNVSPYVSVFLWDKGYIEDMEAMGFAEVAYLPLATDEDIFRPIKLRPSDIKRYGADVGFVGNSMVDSVVEKLKKVPEELHPFLERMAELLSSSRMPFDELLKTIDEGYLEKIKSLIPRLRLFLEAAILWRATLLYRLSCIETLKDFNPCIHGDKDWKKLLGNGYRLGHSLNYYRELPVFYNACKVNFNATSLQMEQAVNQRVFDVPACGGFLLTDHQGAIEELFDVGKEVVTYKDKDEIPELVRFYLDNPDARKAIAVKGRDRVLKEHTYKHRLNAVIQVMKDRYGKNRTTTGLRKHVVNPSLSVTIQVDRLKAEGC